MGRSQEYWNRKKRKRKAERRGGVEPEVSDLWPTAFAVASKTMTQDLPFIDFMLKAGERQQRYAEAAKKMRKIGVGNIRIIVNKEVFGWKFMTLTPVPQEMKDLARRHGKYFYESRHKRTIITP